MAIWFKHPMIAATYAGHSCLVTICSFTTQMKNKLYDQSSCLQPLQILQSKADDHKHYDRFT